LLPTEKFDVKERLYKLQDYIYKEIIYTDISSDTPESVETEKKIIHLLASLFQESPYILQLESAYSELKGILEKYEFPMEKKNYGEIPSLRGAEKDDGLIDPFRRPGAGIEKSREKKDEITAKENKKEQMKSTLREYIDTKIEYKNIVKKNTLLEKITKTKGALLAKFFTLLKLNSIPYIKDLEKVNKEVNFIKESIDKFSSDNQTKKALKEMVNEFKKWKVYSVYNDLKNKITDSVKNISIQSKNFLNRIEKITDPFKTVTLYKKIENKDLDERNKEILKKILEIKLELILMENLDNLVKDFKNQSLPEDSIEKLYDLIEKIISTQDIREYIEELKRLRKYLEERKLLTLKSKYWKNILMSKNELIISKEKIAIENLLKRTNIPSKEIEHFIDLINKFHYEYYEEEIEKAKGQIDKFFNYGFVSKEERDQLKKSIENLYQIEKSKSFIRKIVKEKIVKDENNYVQKRKLEGLINNIFEDNKIGKKIKELANKLVNSKSIKEMELTEREINRFIIEEIRKKTMPHDKIEKLRKNLKKILEIKRKSLVADEILPLIENFTMLKNIINKQNKNKIENILQRLKRNYFEGKNLDKASLEEINTLYDAFLNYKFSRKIEPSLFKWEIFILPEKIILNKKETRDVKVIGLYNRTLLKDITSEVTWRYNPSSIVWIDTQGTIYPIMPGKANIFAEYKGSESAKIEVIVTDSLDSKEIEELEEILK
jgi:hypothetical protein